LIADRFLIDITMKGHNRCWRW